MCSWQQTHVTAEQGGSPLTHHNLGGSISKGGKNVVTGAGNGSVAHDMCQPHVTDLGRCKVRREEHIAAFDIPVHNLQTAHSLPSLISKPMSQMLLLFLSNHVTLFDTSDMLILLQLQLLCC